LQIIHSDNEVHSDRNDFQNLKQLLPYLRAYKGRALLALAFLVFSKMANVSVPLVLKEVIDIFDGKQAQLLVLPVSLLLAYGLFRLLGSLFNELRDTVFGGGR
jgi:ATP-binding cassette subfamily B protein